MIRRPNLIALCTAAGVIPKASATAACPIWAANSDKGIWFIAEHLWLDADILTSGIVNRNVKDTQSIFIFFDKETSGISVTGKDDPAGK
ncbi:hypothetical protein KDX38_08545 [Pseudomonas sp. CDFA 602]|uniref:hypothetical protein n=1 Tax=Pseudomonas californiensis TaxID=2829823 RepID=UPI001E49CABF|nr:hypothetical protein [Pseudomonas californiensis]MCD5993669.1 hypothetical protein [Pseudomonas californiensis]MCD5999264.1 hypothetical protein [Pseudomonas californiensis]